MLYNIRTRGHSLERLFNSVIDQFETRTNIVLECCVTPCIVLNVAGFDFENWTLCMRNCVVAHLSRNWRWLVGYVASLPAGSRNGPGMLTGGQVVGRSVVGSSIQTALVASSMAVVLMGRVDVSRVGLVTEKLLLNEFGWEVWRHPVRWRLCLLAVSMLKNGHREITLMSRGLQWSKSGQAGWRCSFYQPCKLFTTSLQILTID